MTKPAANFTPIPAHQLDILHRMKVPVAQAPALTTVESPDLIIDGVIGYSLKGAPRVMAGDLIRRANTQDSPILALDAPSGVDTTTGIVFNPVIQATATMTLALPKEGLRAPGVEAYVGELCLVDISVPPSLDAKPALAQPVGHLFAKNDVIRLR